jgi:hypothetical protein
MLIDRCSCDVHACEWILGVHVGCGVTRGRPLPNNWGIATELDAKGKLICYREQTRRI